MIGWSQVAGSLALVGVAVALSIWRRLPLEHDIGWAVVRSFVQLIALGYVIKPIFESGHVAYAVPVLALMVVFAAWTARGRARGVPRAFPILLGSLGFAVAATIGLALAVGAIDATSRTLVPIGGAVVGQSMVAASLALSRLEFEVGTARARDRGAPLARCDLAAGGRPDPAAQPDDRDAEHGRRHEDGRRRHDPRHDLGHAARRRTAARRDPSAARALLPARRRHGDHRRARPRSPPAASSRLPTSYAISRLGRLARLMHSELRTTLPGCDYSAAGCVRARARADLFRNWFYAGRAEGSTSPGLRGRRRRGRERDRPADEGRRAARLLQRLPAPGLTALRRGSRAA